MSTPLDLIGNTPLVRISRAVELPTGVELYAKAEWYNLGGSVKDRPALAMLQAGIAEGRLQPGMRIADATSGNTGIAYATIGAALGYGVTLALPANASLERRRTLRALGAELLLTDPAEGTDGAILAIRALVAREPERYFYPDQYSNPANPGAHYATTAPEIWRQTAGRITHFVAALGTSGTFVGATRRLREYNASIKAIAVQPDSPYHALEGVKHMASTRLVPAIYDAGLADTVLEIASEVAFTMALRLARREGLFVGISAAANVAAAAQVARELTGGVVVTILCDSAARYLSERFWEEEAFAEGAGI
jgi:S-sulfo-L-cysteine synthase (O-acetyl-L-serine-dependent)